MRDGPWGEAGPWGAGCGDLCVNLWYEKDAGAGFIGRDGFGFYNSPAV